MIINQGLNKLIQINEINYKMEHYKDQMNFKNQMEKANIINQDIQMSDSIWVNSSNYQNPISSSDQIQPNQNEQVRNSFLRNTTIDKKLASYKKNYSQKKQNKREVDNNKKQQDSIIDIISKKYEVQTNLNKKYINPFEYQPFQSVKEILKKPQQNQIQEYSPSNYNFSLIQSKPLYQHLFKTQDNYSIIQNEIVPFNNQSFIKQKKKVGSIRKQISINNSLISDKNKLETSEIKDYRYENISSQIKKNIFETQQIKHVQFYQPQDQSKVQKGFEKYQYVNKQIQNRQDNIRSVYSTNKNTVYSTIQASQNIKNHSQQIQKQPRYLQNSRYSEHFRSIDYDYEEDLFGFINRQMISLNDENNQLIEKQSYLEQILEEKVIINKKNYQLYQKTKLQKTKNMRKIQQKKKELQNQLIQLKNQVNFYKDMASNIQSSICLKMKRQQDFYYQQENKLQFIKSEKQTKLNELRSELENCKFKKIKNITYCDQINELKIRNKKLQQKLNQEKQLYKRIFRQYLSIESSVNYLQIKKQEQYRFLLNQLQQLKGECKKFSI